jgi:hypothetical protein
LTLDSTVGNNMDEDLRKLREDAAIDLLPSSPAIIQVLDCYASSYQDQVSLIAAWTSGFVISCWT